MNTAVIILSSLVLGYMAGFFIGYHYRELLDKIKLLEKKQPAKPETPTVVMGAYTPPKQVSTATDKRPAGIVEPKTPQRLEWENEQAIEKEGLGR